MQVLFHILLVALCAVSQVAIIPSLPQSFVSLSLIAWLSLSQQFAVGVLLCKLLVMIGLVVVALYLQSLAIVVLV